MRCAHKYFDLAVKNRKAKACCSDCGAKMLGVKFKLGKLTKPRLFLRVEIAPVLQAKWGKKVKVALMKGVVYHQVSALKPVRR